MKNLIVLHYQIIKHNGADKCIYFKFTKNYGVLVYVFVGDIIITRINMADINETKKYLTSQFKIGDLGELSILCIKLQRIVGDLFYVNLTTLIRYFLNLII